MWAERYYRSSFPVRPGGSARGRVGGTSAVTSAAVAGLVAVANMPASAAVVPIGLLVRANAAAHVEPAGALALPTHAVLAAGAGVTARAAVRGIGREVDAGASAGGGA